MERYGLLEKKNQLGRVILVDDQYVNQQLMKQNFEEMGIEGKLVSFRDGLNALQYFEDIFRSFYQVQATGEQAGQNPF